MKFILFFLFLLFALAFLMRAFCQRDVFPSLLHLISLLLQGSTFASHMGAVGSMYHASLLGCQHDRIICLWLGLVLFVIWLFH
jgi:hypothetical protein